MLFYLQKVILSFSTSLSRINIYLYVHYNILFIKVLVISKIFLFNLKSSEYLKKISDIINIID